MLNVNKLKGLVKASPFSVKDIATGIGISERTFYYRLKDGDFKISELCVICQMLGLNINELLEDDDENEI